MKKLGELLGDRGSNLKGNNNHNLKITKQIAARSCRVIFINFDPPLLQNYEDNFDSDVPDLEKQAQKTQDAMTYFLIGSFAFFALLFIFVFPVASFIRMCLKNYDSNVLIVSDVLHCRDPSKLSFLFFYFPISI